MEEYLFLKLFKSKNMKKYLFLTAFALVSFAFSATAQSCCSSKDKAKCAKTAKASTETSMTNEAKAVFVSNTVVATEKTEKFTVYGNCGMCERTIEKSLKKVEGVSKADWDIDTGEMTVTFDMEFITLDAIKQKIADVGYDSDSHRAKDTVYNNLPGCCQYERPI